MRIPRLTAFNVIQFAVTVLAVLFGLYGFIRSNAAVNNAARIHDNHIACAPTEAPVKPVKPLPPGHDPAKEIHQPAPVYKPEPPVVFDAPADSLISGSGRLIGRVKYTNGEAAGNVRVGLIANNLSVTPPVWDQTDLERSRREYDRYIREYQRYARGTVTDGAGRFEFADIATEPGYSVIVGDPKIEQQTQKANAGADLTFTLKIPVLLEGIVSREDGEPLGDYTITVEADRGGWYQPARVERFSKGNGEFRLELVSGKYNVRVDHRGMLQRDRCQVDLTKGNGLVEIVLAKGATLAGVITGTDGLPMAGVTVSVIPPGGGKSDPGFYDGDYEKLGGSRGRGGPAADELKRAEAEKMAKERAAAERDADAKARMRDEEMMKEKLAEELLKLQEREPGMSSRRVSMPSKHGTTAVTDANGRYRLEGLPPGACVVFAQLGGSISARKDATLISGDNVCDITLDSGNRVRVTARDSRGNAVAISGFNLMGERGKYVYAIPVPSSKVGEYEYMGIPAGGYTATITAANFPNVTRQLDISTGANVLDVVFEEPGTLKGRITTSSGRVPKDIYARIALTTPGEDSNSKESKKYGRRNEQHVGIDKDGNYTVKNLTPGSYQFMVTCASSHDEELYKQTVTVASGEQTWDVTIDERCSLIVAVALDAGVKREGVYVSLTPKNNERSHRGYRGTQLNDKGQAEFMFLNEGEYYLSAYAEGAAQSYQPVTIVRGSNLANLSVGPANCVMITMVGEGTQADQLGMKVGDLIVSYNGSPVSTLEQLANGVKATEGQASVSVVVVRNGASLSFTAKGGKLGINGMDHRR